ncbi:MAG: hypothetical protein HYY84_15930 [Deltaproteobacteria bacterium]|nr:hypothetical protein [Deltaproteobacteria bacterium]
MRFFPLITALALPAIGVAQTNSVTEAVEGPFIKAFVQIQSKSYTGIAGIIHPTNGVSVYYTPTSPEVKISAADFGKIATATKKYKFGAGEASGIPIEITAHQFFFGDRSAVTKGAGPLPDWAKAFKTTSDFGLNRALTTAFEGPTHIPTKYAGKPYWAVRYPGTTAVNNWDFSEMRLVFDKAKVSGKNVYRLVAIVCAAPYSP